MLQGCAGSRVNKARMQQMQMRDICTQQIRRFKTCKVLWGAGHSILLYIAITVDMSIYHTTSDLFSWVPRQKHTEAAIGVALCAKSLKTCTPQHYLLPSALAVDSYNPSASCHTHTHKRPIGPHMQTMLGGVNCCRCRPHRRCCSSSC